LAVHLSSIMVGALHGTGDGGAIVKVVKTVKPLIVVVGPPPTVVAVAGGVVVTVVPVTVVLVDVVLVDVVVAGGTVALLLVLQPARPRSAGIATARVRTGPSRRTNGGYGHWPPYPCSECPASSIPRRAT
jgi:hypothetical protein